MISCPKQPRIFVRLVLSLHTRYPGRSIFLQAHSAPVRKVLEILESRYGTRVVVFIV
jgi:hypothetical protein